MSFQLEEQIKEWKERGEGGRTRRKRKGKERRKRGKGEKETPSEPIRKIIEIRKGLSIMSKY